ncbi:PTS sugar transporter subunit IIC, partial [Yersinia pestis]
MWSKEVAGVFFIGFVMTTYLKLPIMAIAILGAAVAVLYYFFSGNNNGSNNNGNNTNKQPEDFEDGI